MTIFPASLTTLICKTPFAMTSRNGCLAPKRRCRQLQYFSTNWLCSDTQFLFIDLSCASGGHSYRNYGKPTHSVIFAVFLRLQLCILYYSMCFCSLLYDALWLGRDAQWPEQFTLWLWLGRDALWPQQFTKKPPHPFLLLAGRYFMYRSRNIK